MGMMKKIGIIFAGVLLISGCATTTNRKISTLETKQAVLEAKVETLEQRQTTLETQNGESRESVGYLKGKVEGSAHGPSTVVVTGASGNEGYVYGKASLTDTDIQVALKNAGYYTGAIDGKIGRKTRKAIKEFQKANGLKANGKVGPKTKELLAQHLKQETR